MRGREGSWILWQLVLLGVFVAGFSYVYFTYLNQPLPEVENVPCASCQGRGTQECLFCKGHGFVESFSPGSFSLNSSKPAPRKIEKCTSCNGSGKKPCGACWGKGTVPKVAKRP